MLTKKYSTEDILIVITGVTIGLVVILLITIWQGFVISRLWQWFIVPLFEVKGLSIPQAIGLALFAGMFTNESSSGKDDESNAKWIKVLIKLFAPLIIGWIVYQFAGSV